MLRTYVVSGQVDYTLWQKESARELDQWLASLQTADLSAMGRESAIAFLINLYNALVIRQVLQKYPIRSIRPKVLGVPNWASFLLFFKQSVYSLGDRTLSLDNIEQDILRPQYDESRTHFALVCASTGCPLLRSEAYTPDQVLDQLEADAQRFINDTAKVNYDAASNTLYCSKIFKWYEDDFAATAGSVPDYIQTYLAEATIPANVNIVYLPYSWQLNDQRTFS
ncbi:DUF547 domain-containing protein [cf. Phormidesmis sp. LEGE 11477]|nr:DUF547 domain-containing protein [cf. Phormidesmis sp. LEGE 11477]